MSDALFDIDQPPPAPRLSPDQRRTQRQRDMIAKGIHPATQRALLPGTQTCGTCDHLARSWGRYLKCGLVTRSASTDIRAGWPACVLWQEARP